MQELLRKAESQRSLKVPPSRDMKNLEKPKKPFFMPVMNFKQTDSGSNLWESLTNDIFKTKHQPKKDLNYRRFMEHFTIEDLHKDDFDDIAESIQQKLVRKRQKDGISFNSEGWLV